MSTSKVPLMTEVQLQHATDIVWALMLYGYLSMNIAKRSIEFIFIEDVP